MKSLFLLTAIVLLSVWWGAPSDTSLTLHMIGDSTMSVKHQRAFPETGWGVPFVHYFSDELRIVNYARNGRSSKTFREEGLWNEVVLAIKPGDVVFIQFGHNDEDPRKPQSTTPQEFAENLHRYVAESLQLGAQPVLFTPVARRRFDANGNVRESHPVYSEVVRQVAYETGVVLIDHDASSMALLAEMGEAESKWLFNQLHTRRNPNYPDGIIDNTHFNELGARMMAELVIIELREKLPELVSYLYQEQ